MVETITPVVYGGRNRTYWTAVIVHTLGATASAAVLGLVLGGAGAILGAPWDRAGWWVLAAVAVVYALREGIGLPVPLPDLDRQVPEWWRTFYSPPIAALLYGLGLGVGFVTFLSFGTFAVVAAGSFVAGDPLLGALLCAPFGLARGLSVLAAVHNLGTQEDSGVRDVLEGMAMTRIPRYVNAAALAAIATGVALT
ncbi:MAG: hypothetical protein ACRDLB_04540 [Actinomycetota bacterium]